MEMVDFLKSTQISQLHADTSLERSPPKALSIEDLNYREEKEIRKSETQKDSPRLPPLRKKNQRKRLGRILFQSHQKGTNL